MTSPSARHGSPRRAFTRVPIWGTPPRSPALALVGLLSGVIAWVAISSTTGSRFSLATVVFCAALIVIALMAAGMSGVWESDRHIRLRMGPVHQTVAKSHIAGFTMQRSFWTNGIRVLSLVTTSGEIIPVPGWMLRSETRDRAAIDLLQRAIGADPPLPMLLTRAGERGRRS